MRTMLLLGLMTCASAYLASPASSTPVVYSVFRLSCEQGYNVDVLQKGSGEISYHSTGPSGDLSLGGGTNDGGASGRQVYTFQNGNYKYRVTRSYFEGLYE